MADQAMRDTRSMMVPALTLHVTRPDGTGDGDGVPESFGSPLVQPREGDGAAPPARDWSSALDLIREATEAINLSEERANELETQLQQVTSSANEEIRQLSAKLMSAERRMQKAEERARTSDARANEAETWLARLHDAVFSGFDRKARGSNRPDAVMLNGTIEASQPRAD